MNIVRAPRRQKGFLIIAAVFLLVVLAGLVAYLTTVSTTSQAASASDLNATRAYQAARTGAEWASYLLREAAPGGAGTLKTDCAAAPTTKTLVPGSTLAGFTVTVNCSSSTYTEGALTGPTAVRVYSITSNACNEPDTGVCPNNTTTASTYVDRQVILTITN